MPRYPIVFCNGEMDYNFCPGLLSAPNPPGAPNTHVRVTIPFNCFVVHNMWLLFCPTVSRYKFKNTPELKDL